MEKKKKPAFNVMNLGFFKSVKKRWRRPRGTHNKKRMKFQWTGASPRIGYRNAAEMRDIHPSGLREMLVNNPAELEGLAGVVLRIASGVGGKKRALIEGKAKALKLRVVNSSEKKAEWAPQKAAKPAAPKAAPAPKAAHAAQKSHGAGPKAAQKK